MNPTMTEHDFRFPRRPTDSAPNPNNAERGGAAKETKGAGMRNTLQEYKEDLDNTVNAAQDRLSRNKGFPDFQDGMAGMSQSPNASQDDPLATQVWRFFSKTKQQLPNQERMENLTWRMMHVNLRKRIQEEKSK